ncbi:MAG: SDR family NAD(P)-dependent oxidoreductase [Pseudomonadota bacterium]|uniref:SDR family NAD(P)-dependent oxidoreductase n=1 Tax=Roseovarius TaxID=74030 RepID=UPI0022A671F6|nr:SDR family NAD(P)-dependent oxidoreductase [Roseovarius sp. EGI FJ00037]MCZ0811644.1 SDR family NAD(P)-dependent oxidoreductase [Roseovarius sp. EGI FJ00037]
MENRVALISGASGGIGASIAQLLTQRGWSLSLGARDPDSLAQRFPDAHVVRHDATACDEADWVDAARARFGRIDAVICSAGIMVPEDVVEIEDETLDRMWEINVKSPRRLARAAWGDLVACGQGRVILLVSLSGKRVRSAASSSYGVTKHAALALSHGLRRKGWEDGVRATAVCPGRVRTNMTRGVTGIAPEDMTQPENVADMVGLALDMPNNASVAEMTVNCDAEDQY